jgi:hypothetical protein
MNATVVLTTRNDTFSGTMKEITTACLQTMSETFDEVIVVDLGSKDPLYPLLREIIPEEKTNIRVITVSYEWLIARVPDTTTMPDVLGRNIGIRRASNDIILCTNIDIIPSPKDNFDLSTFDQTVFYTSGRYEVGQPLISKLRAEGRSWKSVQQYLFDTRNLYYRQVEFHGDPWSIMNCPGDFQMGHRDIWHNDEVRGFEESMIYKNYVDTNLHKKINANAHYKISNAPFLHVFHQSHQTRDGVKKSNNMHEAVHGFGHTTNPDTWGASEEKFKENII